ncbi:MGH1-like glycoside hydrolase domain-containing protein [Pseudoruegeria sp. SHC-113]|uniref:MGH1-like glycoside hydrolase domain-containing protein n=1 Tax=Pseudoruegeria sp. SHC-113 TaxID=2855439 RepID=UPI0021BB7EE0|nr:hypothetical protein [Pseudoruegeria sp. SHC-113]
MTDNFRNGLGNWPERQDEMTVQLDQQARDIMTGNDRGGYTVPTSGLYPYQWNWDSMFAAWGFATFDRARAWAEVDTLLASQWENGMVPHIIFHREVPEYFPGPEVWGRERSPATSGISQPPVAATLIRWIYEADTAEGEAHLRAVYPKLLDWHRWFMAHRCERGMIVVTHPWESGRDNAADWDAAMANVDGSGVGEYTRRDTSHVDGSMRPTKEQYDRYLAMVYFGRNCHWDEAVIRESSPFRVADPGMSFIFLRACRDLAALGAALGEDTSEIEDWIAVLEAGAANHWNPLGGYYDSVDIRTGEFCGALSSGAFLCWYAGIGGDAMLPSLERIMQAVRYPVPSLDPADPRFDAPRYWRGPMWGMFNALTARGLAEAGHREIAKDLRARTAECIAQNGFYEYFNPVTGAPAGGGLFTWTAAIWLTWASPTAEGRA